MTARSGVAAMRPLSRQEIDDRIHRLVDEVLADRAAPGGDSGEPRWIAAAELVRRMQPFVSSN